MTHLYLPRVDEVPAWCNCASCGTAWHRRWLPMTNSMQTINKQLPNILHKHISNKSSKPAPPTKATRSAPGVGWLLFFYRFRPWCGVAGWGSSKTITSILSYMLWAGWSSSKTMSPGNMASGVMELANWMREPCGAWRNNGI